MFPFGHLNNFEMGNLNLLDSMHLINTVPEFEICVEARKLNNLKSRDIDENIVHSINSKYYTCQQFVNIENHSNEFTTTGKYYQ